MTETEIREGLDRWFGYDDFRDGQYAPIEAVVNGRDAVPFRLLRLVAHRSGPGLRAPFVAQERGRRAGHSGLPHSCKWQ